MTQEEKIEKYELMLQRYVRNKSFVKISQTIGETENDVSGFLIDISDDFLLIQNTLDFSLDGYVIIRQDDFDSIRHSDYERTQGKIYRAEGIIKKQYGLDVPISLLSWPEIFKSLKAADIHVIVENDNKDELEFWIGPVIKVNKNSVCIYNYDPNGKFDLKKTIKYDTIRIVRFGDRYSTTFRKYLKSDSGKK